MVAQDYTIWQRMSEDELDLEVRILIALRLIRRRRIYIRYRTDRFVQIGRVTWQVTSSKDTDTVRPSWEYKITKAAELILRVQAWWQHIRRVRIC